jgi:hypothetical protein
MAKVIIHFDENEHTALQLLAEREYRTITAQIALMIHRQLQDLNLIICDENVENQPQSSSQTEAL